MPTGGEKWYDRGMKKIVAAAELKRTKEYQVGNFRLRLEQVRAPSCVTPKA